MKSKFGGMVTMCLLQEEDSNLPVVLVIDSMQQFIQMVIAALMISDFDVGTMTDLEDKSVSFSFAAYTCFYVRIGGQIRSTYSVVFSSV